MTEAFDRVLRRYLDRAEREHRLAQEIGPAMIARRDEMLLEVGEPVARLLLDLAVARDARCLVELGTSYGFSTLFLAEAARRTGGKLFTFELSAEKQSYARAQIDEAGLADHVEWRCGDAVELLRQLDGPVDFALIDLWKDLYVPCLDLLHPRLADRAIIVADNMLYPPMARADAEVYRAAIRAKGDLQTVLLPLGSGIELSCVWRGTIA